MLVITTCTRRKRKPISDSLHMAALPQQDLPDLAVEWSRRLAAETTRYRSDEIYGGRGFKEAVTTAALLEARLLVISAGLGLIDAKQSVPSYACTVLMRSPDSVAGRSKNGIDPVEWWRLLGEASPFSVKLHEVVADNEGLICAALSEAYIEMVLADLTALSAETLSRLRLFTRAPISRIPKALRSFVMPYDDRLDGPDSPHRGTRSDFAGRALRHFAEAIAIRKSESNVGEHAEAVGSAISCWRMPAQVTRVRHDDGALLDLIREHWDAESGSSSRLLRRFRDKLGVACEQGRFAQLARTVRNERA